MREQNTKRLIHRLRSLSNDALVQHLLGILISDIAEAADRLEELSKAQGEPLSEDEIRDCAEQENLPYFENKEEFDAFARAIEKAHGIGGGA